MLEQNKSNRYIQLLIEFAETELDSEMKSACETFFRNLDFISGDNPHAEMRFLEWFIFDWRCPQSRRSLIEIFLDDFSEELNSKDIKILKGFTENVFSFFEVLEIKVGRIRMRDLSTDKHYNVLEYLGSFQLKAHDILISRLLPWKTQWVLSGPAIPLRGEIAYLMKRDFLRMHSSGTARNITALSIYQTLGTALKEKQMDSEWQANMPQIRKQMGRAMKHFLVKEPISLKDLEEWIVNDRPDEEIRQEIIRRTQFKDIKEIESHFGGLAEQKMQLASKTYQKYEGAIPLFKSYLEIEWDIGGHIEKKIDGWRFTEVWNISP